MLSACLDHAWVSSCTLVQKEAFMAMLCSHPPVDLASRSDMGFSCRHSVTGPPSRARGSVQPSRRGPLAQYPLGQRAGDLLSFTPGAGAAVGGATHPPTVAACETDA